MLSAVHEHLCTRKPLYSPTPAISAIPSHIKKKKENMSQRWSNNDDTKRRKGASSPAAMSGTKDTHEHNNTSKSTVTPQVQDSKPCAQVEYIEFSKDIEKLKEEMIEIVTQ